jgi:hypothetical protein
VRGRATGVEYRAADQAKRKERELWLPTLEQWLMDVGHADDTGSVILRGELKREIRRLRRLVGTSPEAKRNATRLRVQRYRERQKAK